MSTDHEDGYNGQAPSTTIRRQLKISIGLRLFASVLVAILVVAATAVALMRQNVVDSFGDYALQIELDRLDQLAGDLARRYASRGGWDFIRGPRDTWITRTLSELQQQRALPAPVAPVEPVAPVAPVAVAGAVAPVPPAPPAPPLPPPLVAPEAPPAPGADAEALALPDRITLLDTNGAYLAGHRGGGAGARRPVVVKDRTVGYLAVARTSVPSDAMSGAFYTSVRSSLWIIGAAGIALSAAAAMLLAAHFRKPVHELAGGARELAAGRYDTRLPDARSDELGELARAFNQLAHKLGSAERSRRQWVADTSHELRTPLSVLRAQLEAIQDGVRPASAETVAAMLRQVLSLNKLIDDLYALAQADVGEQAYQYQRLDLCRLANEEAAAFAGKFAAARMSIAPLAAAPATAVLADPERLRQVFSNLFENCVRYCGSGARIELSARVDKGELTVAIDDNGPGVPPQALAHLAERFYRVDQSRNRASGGAGLGLALCQRIVQAHQGRLAFAPSAHGGLRVSITLPLASA